VYHTQYTRNAVLSTADYLFFFEDAAVVLHDKESDDNPLSSASRSPEKLSEDAQAVRPWSRSFKQPLTIPSSQNTVSVDGTRIVPSGYRLAVSISQRLGHEDDMPHAPGDPSSEPERTA